MHRRRHRLTHSVRPSSQTASPTQPQNRPSSAGEGPATERYRHSGLQRTAPIEVWSTIINPLPAVLAHQPRSMITAGSSASGSSTVVSCSRRSMSCQRASERLLDLPRRLLALSQPPQSRCSPHEASLSLVEPSLHLTARTPRSMRHRHCALYLPPVRPLYCYHRSWCVTKR
jgi:hypothetical protein